MPFSSQENGANMASSRIHLQEKCLARERETHDDNDSFGLKL